MTSSFSTPSSGSNVVAAVAAVIVGSLVCGYGLLLVPESVLGGGWITAIGLALVLSGLVTTEWIGDRLGLSPTGRHQLSLSFVALAVVLLVAFVVINGATFEANEIESS